MPIAGPHVSVGRAKYTIPDPGGPRGRRRMGRAWPLHQAHAEKVAEVVGTEAKAGNRIVDPCPVGAP